MRYNGALNMIAAKVPAISLTENDEDPPFVAGAFENNFDESLADIKGRFWYLQLKKRF